MVDESRSQFPHKFFMEVFIIMAWSIWKQRNNFIFNKVRPIFRVGNLASWMRLVSKLIE
jgi:hypothetical protein